MPAKNFGCEAGHVILLLQGRLGSTVFLREERYYPVRIVVLGVVKNVFFYPVE